MRKKLGRPSPALSVAFVALFAALSGTAVGATLIDGARIKNRSINYTKIRPDSLGGVVIKESRLGKVPRATRADSARSADGTRSVGGLQARKLFYKSAVSAADTTLYEDNGLTISARCSATGGGTPVVLARTSIDNAAFRSTVIDGSNGVGSTETADFDRTTAPLNVLAGKRSAQGTLTYYGPGGNVTTVTFAGEGGPSLGQASEGGSACTFAGTAFGG